MVDLNRYYDLAFETTSKLYKLLKSEFTALTEQLKSVARTHGLTIKNLFSDMAENSE